MILPYTGEFMVSPAPLELSFGPCSYGCRYCFARLNKYVRKYDYNRDIRLLQSIDSRVTLEAALLREKYPVVISNKTDPFCKPNEDHAISIITMLAEIEVPVAIQTKGGKRAFEAAEVLPPSCWYVSISFDNDNMREHIERNTPTLNQRYALIEDLVGLGHTVSVGVNPYVPEWIEDEHLFLQRLKGLGVFGLWIEGLHFSSEQCKNLSIRDTECLGTDIVTRAKKRKLEPGFSEGFLHFRQIAKDMGFACFTNGQPEPSSYFLQFEKNYDKLFPTTQGAINYYFENNMNGAALVSPDDFISAAGGELIKGKYSATLYYVTSKNRQVARKTKFPSKSTALDIFKFAWEDPRISFCPANNGLFSYAVAENDDGYYQLTDENGCSIMMFSETPHDEYNVVLERG